MEEEVVEVATKVAFSFKPMVLVATSVVSLAAGTALGLIVGSRRMEKKYTEIASREINEARERYERQNKVGQYATPEDAAKKLLVDAGLVEDDKRPIVVPEEVVRVFKDYNGGVDPRPPLEENNVFAAPPVDPSSLVETSGKFVSPVNKNGPYPITEDEFTDGEVGYNQVSLTYFAGDDILADEKEAPIEDVEMVVGEASLKHFHDEDPSGNIVYVRNSKIELDFEITRSMGKYSVEVAGLPDTDLQHSAYPAKRRRSK